jgi:hypothetical protein
MKPFERATENHHDPRGPRQIRGCILALAGVAALIPGAVLADTVLTYNLNSSSDLAASGSTPSAFCTAGTACPGGTPAFALTQNVPLSGTISIDLTNSTMSFDLTLTQNASFGNGLTLDTGSSFVASTASPVSVGISSSTKKGVTTDTVLSGSTSTALGTLLLSSGFTQTQGQGIVSSLDCSVIVGGAGTCGFVIGTPVSGTDALQISNGTTPYDGVMSISANMTPVPLPSSIWLMLAAAGGLLFRRPRALASCAA